MSRRKSLDPTVRWQVRIPESLISQVEPLLPHDLLEEKILYGARGALVSILLRRWLWERHHGDALSTLRTLLHQLHPHSLPPSCQEAVRAAEEWATAATAALAPSAVLGHNRVLAPQAPTTLDEEPQS